LKGSISSAAREASGVVGRTRILVVDDDVALRDALCQCCDEEGFEAVGAGTVARGLELAATGTFDAALVDLTLPDGDGFALLAGFRAGPASAHLPAIVVTGRTDKALLCRAFAAGAHDYLTKPSTRASW